MMARIWKKLGFIILIIACLFNITYKIVKKTPFVDELKSSVQYVLQNDEEKK